MFVDEGMSFDEFHLFNKTLSKPEIEDLYNENKNKSNTYNKLRSSATVYQNWSTTATLANTVSYDDASLVAYIPFDGNTVEFFSNKTIIPIKEKYATDRHGALNSSFEGVIKPLSEFDDSNLTEFTFSVWSTANFSTPLKEGLSKTGSDLSDFYSKCILTFNFTKNNTSGFLIFLNLIVH